jgi:hypothetical protein
MIARDSISTIIYQILFFAMFLNQLMCTIENFEFSKIEVVFSPTTQICGYISMS